MSSDASNPIADQRSAASSRWSLLIKAARFVAVTALFGWLYGWASPKCFPPDRQSDYVLGFVHGALMPMALPSLVMGKNVEIFASNNSGRPYKIAYICGINACGLVFFGSMFLSPKRKPVTSASSHKSE